MTRMTTTFYPLYRGLANYIRRYEPPCLSQAGPAVIWSKETTASSKGCSCESSILGFSVDFISVARSLRRISKQTIHQVDSQEGSRSMVGFIESFRRAGRKIRSVGARPHDRADGSVRICETVPGVLECDSVFYGSQAQESPEDIMYWDSPYNLPSVKGTFELRGSHVERQLSDEEEDNEREEAPSAYLSSQRDSFLPSPLPSHHEYYLDLSDFDDNPSLAGPGSRYPPFVSSTRRLSLDQTTDAYNTITNAPTQDGQPDDATHIEEESCSHTEASPYLQYIQYRNDKYPRPDNLYCEDAYQNRIRMDEPLLDMIHLRNNRRLDSKGSRWSVPSGPPMVTSSVSVTPPKLALDFELQPTPAEGPLRLFSHPVSGVPKICSRPSSSAIHKTISYPSGMPFRSYHFSQTTEDIALPRTRPVSRVPRKSAPYVRPQERDRANHGRTQRGGTRSTSYPNPHQIGRMSLASRADHVSTYRGVTRSRSSPSPYQTPHIPAADRAKHVRTQGGTPSASSPEPSYKPYRSIPGGHRAPQGRNDSGSSRGIVERSSSSPKPSYKPYRPALGHQEEVRGRNDSGSTQGRIGRSASSAELFF